MSLSEGAKAQETDVQSVSSDVPVTAERLFCKECHKWFTESEVSPLGEVLPLPGDYNYEFTCTACGNGTQSYHHLPQRWLDVAFTALYTLTSRNENNTRYFPRQDVCAVADAEWERCAIGRVRTDDWAERLLECLSTEQSFFVPDPTDASRVGLRIAPQTHAQPPATTPSPAALGGGAAAAAQQQLTRKRKADAPVTPAKKKKQRSADGWDDTLASPPEIPPTAMAGAPLFHMPHIEAPDYTDGVVRLSPKDRAPQLDLQSDTRIVGEKGYRMARATHGVDEGTWYYEVRVLPSEKGHVRLGWATRKADLQGPIGFDEYGYGYRDIKGHKVHNSRPKMYGREYGIGDVIGFLIYLPPNPDRQNRDDDKLPVTPAYMLGHHSNKKSDKRKKRRCKEAYVEYFKNGVSQGIAYDNLFEGKYYPAVSLYMEAVIEVNFGPTFQCEPDTSTEYRPMADLNHYTGASTSPADLARWGRGKSSLATPQKQVDVPLRVRTPEESGASTDLLGQLPVPDFEGSVGDLSDEQTNTNALRLSFGSEQMRERPSIDSVSSITAM